MLLPAVVLLTGCGLLSPGAQPDGSGGEGGGPALSELPVQRTTEALQKVNYKSAQQIPGPGEYIVDLATGEVESWVLWGEPSNLIRFSDDYRWVVAETDDQVYWINRESGEGFSWSKSDLKLVGGGPSQLLLAEGQADAGPRDFYVVNYDFEVQHTFSLDLEDRTVSQVEFSPDGEDVAIAAVRQPTLETVDLKVVLVDLGSGTVREISGYSQAEGQVVHVGLWDGPRGDLMVEYIVQEIDRAGLTTERSVVRRYSWEGELLGEFAVLGRVSSLSKDRSLIVSTQDLDRLANAAVLIDLATGEPLLRVVNAWPGKMTADSTALVVRGGPQGGYHLVTVDGQLRSLPPGYGFEGSMPLYGGVRPSPDDPQRLLFGLNVTDLDGEVIQRVDVPDRDDWLIWDAAWGADGGEVFVRIVERVGKGNLSSDMPLPIQVQKPPFSDPYLLEVRDPQGECVNLREANRRDSPVIRCLPNGTKLAVADLFEAPEKMNRATLYEDGFYGDPHIWLWARTDQGEVGWVSFTTGSVTWAQ